MFIYSRNMLTLELIRQYSWVTLKLNKMEPVYDKVPCYTVGTVL